MPMRNTRHNWGLAGAAVALALLLPLLAGGDTSRVPAYSINIGNTPVNGGATAQLLFNLGGFVSSDADCTFVTDALTCTKINASGGVSLNTTTTNHRIISKTVTLTEAGGAETVITVTNAAGDSFGLEFTYRVHVSDATPDYAIREGSLKLVCVNKATAVSCTKDATAQTDDESVLISPATSKTLTYAIAVDVATANTAKITFNIDSDIVTVAVGTITYTAIINGVGTVS
jgi:hypothetical protein